MSSPSLLNRFSGMDGHRRLVDALRAQDLIIDSPGIASELANLLTLVEINAGDYLIRQGDTDNDAFVIISGSFSILVNDREVATRGRGQHVGEMALVDASAARTASVRAIEQSLVGRIDEPHFVSLANSNPTIWRRMVIELSRRLDERRQFHRPPNPIPIVFFGSSTEFLPIAEATAKYIPATVAETRLWKMDGIFEASNFPIEDLERQLANADFAVLVVGADDTVISRGVTSDAPRDNVIFEAGLFTGSLSRSRTYLLAPKDRNIKIPSDLLGIGCLRYDSTNHDLAAATADASKELQRLIGTRGSR